MIESEISKTEQIRNAILEEAVLVDDFVQPVILNHKKGTVVEPYTFIVRPKISLETISDLNDFGNTLLKDQHGIYRWNQKVKIHPSHLEYGILYALERKDQGFIRRIEVQMFPNEEVALRSSKRMREELNFGK